MNKHSSIVMFLTWLMYTVLCPIIAVSYYVLLTFNPYDSFWFYDSSISTYPALHPINIIGFFVSLYGAAAWIIIIALTHFIFQTTTTENNFKKNTLVDYSAGYLFLVFGLCGSCAFFGYDPLNTATNGGLFGQQMHWWLSAIGNKLAEQIILQFFLVGGIGLTIGFYWAHYITVACQTLLYPLRAVKRVLLQQLINCCTLCKSMYQKIIKPQQQEGDNELEITVYMITKKQSPQLDIQ